MTSTNYDVYVRARPSQNQVQQYQRTLHQQIGRRSGSRAKSPETYDSARQWVVEETAGETGLTINGNEVIVLPNAHRHTPRTGGQTQQLQNRGGQRMLTPRGLQSNNFRQQQQFTRVNSAASNQSRTSEYERRFTNFKQCFSSDKHSTEFATQQDVYDTIGRPVLEDFVRGINVCILAYGQTGSGKTYTMLGPHWDEIQKHWSPARESERDKKRSLMKLLEKSNEKGLMLRICEDLFQHIAALKADTDIVSSKFEVTVTYYQIYQEKVTCLIEPLGPLAVRHDKERGPHVEKITTVPVKSFRQILELLEKGSRNRRESPTIHNEYSSRSHAVFSLTFVSEVQRHGRRSERTTSTMNLVDLAGSEQLGGTNMDVQRRQETTNINRSLSTLNRVINALATLKGKKGFVPYRESTLTWLLKDSLGGNSRTVLVATVSPDMKDQPESVSTLRYAGTAKKIVNNVVRNFDERHRVKVLEAELLATRQRLETAAVTPGNLEMERMLQLEVQELRVELEEAKKAADFQRMEMEARQAEQEERTMELLRERDVREDRLKSQVQALQMRVEELESASPTSPEEHVEIRRGDLPTPHIKRSHYERPWPRGLSSSPPREATQPRPSSISPPPTQTTPPPPATAVQRRDRTVRFVEDEKKGKPRPRNVEEEKLWLQMLFDANPEREIPHSLMLRMNEIGFVPPSTIRVKPPKQQVQVAARSASESPANGGAEAQRSTTPPAPVSHPPFSGGSQHHQSTEVPSQARPAPNVPALQLMARTDTATSNVSSAGGSRTGTPRNRLDRETRLKILQEQEAEIRRLEEEERAAKERRRSSRSGQHRAQPEPMQPLALKTPAGNEQERPSIPRLSLAQPTAALSHWNDAEVHQHQNQQELRTNGSQRRASSSCSSVAPRPTQLAFQQHFDAAMDRIDSPNPSKGTRGKSPVTGTTAPRVQRYPVHRQPQ